MGWGETDAHLSKTVIYLFFVRGEVSIGDFPGVVVLRLPCPQPPAVNELLELLVTESGKTHTDS